MMWVVSALRALPGRSRAWVLLMGLFLCASSWAQGGPLLRTLDLPCGAQVTLSGDLLQPAGSAPVPLILLVHGGGWAMGSRREYAPLQQQLAQWGWASLSIDYRLVPAARFPAQIEDVKCAARYVQEHSMALRVLPGRIAALGGSAGAHLVALAAATPGRWEAPAYRSHREQPFRCVILHGAPLDLPDWWAHSDPHLANTLSGRNMLRALLGADYTSHPERYIEASPITYATPAMPPTLLIHGQQDDIVPPRQSERFAARLRALGVPVDYLPIPDADHGGFGRHGEEVGARVLDFLRRCAQ